jgi:hypothetical protein
MVPWTEQTIAIELRRFVVGRGDWPRHREFVETGRKGLYHAILKHGGTRHWAERVGVEFSPDRARGRPWSEERVRVELTQFLDYRDRWPSGAEFATAGQGALLRAVRRFGGSARWEREFGLDRVADDNNPTPLLRYVLRPQARTSKRRYWTDQRIAETIGPLIGELGRWPTKGEYRRAGLLNALNAVYDHGGSARWRARFGVSPRAQTAPVPDRRKWTQRRIDAELARFCMGRSDWPTRREFDAAGRRSLYAAVARNGGIAYWKDRSPVDGKDRS